MFLGIFVTSFTLTVFAVSVFSNLKELFVTLSHRRKININHLSINKISGYYQIINQIHYESKPIGAFFVHYVALLYER